MTIPKTVVLPITPWVNTYSFERMANLYFFSGSSKNILLFFSPKLLQMQNITYRFFTYVSSCIQTK